MAGVKLFCSCLLLFSGSSSYYYFSLVAFYLCKLAVSLVWLLVLIGHFILDLTYFFYTFQYLDYMMFGIKYFGIRVLPGNILNFIGICVFFMPTFMNLGLSLHLTGMAWHLSILFFERAISLIHYIAISVFMSPCSALISMSCLRLWGILFGHLPCLLSGFLMWVFTALGFPPNTTLATSQRFQESCASRSHSMLGNCSFPLWFLQWPTTH